MNVIHEVVIRICQDCIDLRGEECHEPDCVFCFRGMEEVREILDRILVCPIIDGERYVLAGDAVEDAPMPVKKGQNANR